MKPDLTDMPRYRRDRIRARKAIRDMRVKRLLTAAPKVATGFPPDDPFDRYGQLALATFIVAIFLAGMLNTAVGTLGATLLK